MKINYSYTVEGELRRVEDTVNREKFFRENGYQPTFPEGLNFENFNITKAKVRIKKEFAEDLVNRVKDKLDRDWEKHRSQIESFLEILPYEKPSELNIVFTRYGMGGSYYVPNKIIINLRNVNSPLFILTHELLHLLIEEPVILKHKLSQWDKESLVDYLFNESQAIHSLFSWTDYQKKAPSRALLKKVGWDSLQFERTKPRKQNPLVAKYSKEVSDFFGIPETRVNVFLIQSREEYDRIAEEKSENWMVGFTRSNTVFILDRDKFESESNHPKSDFEPVLKHEIAHIYYRKLKHNGAPAWLNEGTACFVAGQNKKPPTEDLTVKTLEKYHDNGGAGVYSIGRYMVDNIVKNYGKEKLFELIVIDDRNKRYKELKSMFEWLK
jgi:hypothetical protein